MIFSIYVCQVRWIVKLKDSSVIAESEQSVVKGVEDGLSRSYKVGDQQLMTLPSLCLYPE